MKTSRRRSQKRGRERELKGTLDGPSRTIEVEPVTLPAPSPTQTPAPEREPDRTPAPTRPS